MSQPAAATGAARARAAAFFLLLTILSGTSSPSSASPWVGAALNQHQQQHHSRRHQNGHRCWALPPLGPQEGEALQLLMLAMDGVVNSAEEGVLDSAGTAILKWLADLNYGNVFAASLFPYLLFLRNIWPKDYPIPKTMKYGFASLLIFVVSTIIGGVVAKIQYNDVLANVDYLHGVAESLLGVTNIVLALSAYQALEAAKRDGPREDRRWTE